MAGRCRWVSTTTRSIRCDSSSDSGCPLLVIAGTIRTRSAEPKTNVGIDTAHTPCFGLLPVVAWSARVSAVTASVSFALLGTPADVNRW